jgi:hypothetical protein
MTLPQGVSAQGRQEEQPVTLEDKVNQLTSDIEALRSRMASAKGPLASLRAATGRLALMQGVGSALLKEFGVAAPTFRGVPMK